MATNRATARRRSARTAFEDDDAPAVKRAKTDVNGTGKRTNGATKKAAKTGEFGASVVGNVGCGRVSSYAQRVNELQLEGKAS